MAYCLPPELGEKFKAAIKDGTINPDKLSEMSSEDRRNFFSSVVGEDNAKDVNAQFESKLLLKDQQAGMIRWAKSVTGITEAAKRDILSRIERMDKVLQPEDPQHFLEDLASKKLGVHVVADEAQHITELAQKASRHRDDMEGTPGLSPERNAYGRALIDLNEYVDSLKPTQKLNMFSQIVNLPKSMTVSIFHMSAPFVQGWGMMSTGVFWEGFGKQFQYFASEDAYKSLNADIISHPDYPLALDGKLGLTKVSDKLSEREEQIQSSLLEHVPVLKVAVKASSRGFTGFLNYVRFSRFTQLLDAARLSGEDISKGSQAVKDIAQTVNDFTGRGALGKDDRYASIQPVANSMFFSPRKIIATVNMFNPIRYLDPRISPTARAGAIRQLSGSVIATASILELAHLAGAKVNTNPIATNFLKIQLGNTTLDLTGGNAIYTRLIARIIEGKSISSTGKLTKLTGTNFGSTSRADQIVSYTRDKLSPTASFVADALYGKDPSNKPFSVSAEAYDKLVPLVMQNFINVAMNDPKNGAAWVSTLSGIFGVDIQSNKK